MMIEIRSLDTNTDNNLILQLSSIFVPRAGEGIVVANQATNEVKRYRVIRLTYDMRAYHPNDPAVIQRVICWVVEVADD